MLTPAKRLIMMGETKKKYRNLVVNGSFENGITGWDNIGVTVSADDKLEGQKSVKFTNNNTTIKAAQAVAVPQGHIVYVCTFAKIVSYTSGNTAAYLRCAAGASSSALGGIIIANPTILNDWQGLSVILTVPLDGANAITFRIYSYNSVAVGYFDCCAVVDLTVEFGAGNEPDQAWCDANIPQNIIW